MGDQYDISIDPGTNHTGFCVWLKGRPVQTGVWNAPKNLEYEEKALWMKAQCKALIVELADKTLAWPVRRVAIEDFPTHHADHQAAMNVATNSKSMMKCAGIQMILFSLAHDMATEIPIRVSKGKTSKADALLIARDLGVITKSKDCADAVAIGIAAGFDKRPA